MCEAAGRPRERRVERNHRSNRGGVSMQCGMYKWLRTFLTTWILFFNYLVALCANVVGTGLLTYNCNLFTVSIYYSNYVYWRSLSSSYPRRKLLLDDVQIKMNTLAYEWLTQFYSLDLTTHYNSRVIHNMNHYIMSPLDYNSYENNK